ncbi:MAG: 30S ribosomal protein S17 [Deltaproteobacteria bacterium]|nr:30S ribosomal protein S17 [Deltaproteobacteria bacterium]MCB9787360.1 30S ribosomal protein S17 [Deltaproteobacteria bacterium]
MSERGNKKQLVGLVASDKNDKTVVVEVTRRTRHPIYHKYISRRKRYQAHDELNDCRVGDRVLIEECRPLSRHKHWRIKQVLDRAV